MAFSRWPAKRLLLLATVWGMLALAWSIWRGLEMLPNPPGGIAAVSLGLWPVIYLCLGPPFAMVLAWLVARRLSKE
jgi:hypothetical protein